MTKEERLEYFEKYLLAVDEMMKAQKRYFNGGRLQGDLLVSKKWKSDVRKKTDYLLKHQVTDAVQDVLL